MNRVNYLLTGKSMNPGFVGTPTRPNLGDDHEIIRVRMQRLLNNLIGHVGTVEVACVDMIDPRLYRLAKNRNCGISIDTSDFYGPHVTNQIIKQALHPYPD